MILFDFNSNSNITKWNIINDAVMGGCSKGEFYINPAGCGVFEGQVSLENNGGFSLLQYKFNTILAVTFSQVRIKLKGDGKPYQFRIKTNRNDPHSYNALVQTTGDWQTLEIPFNTLYPAFRGKRLNTENYPGKQLETIGFLIGNKKAEVFKLEIDYIVLE
ncbi:CIA30 family protein [Mariniflexile ostreae]|uniref:CIA30 family protein n=1 Tax=Mariniflexile ostreae TaxID=1520892 RepID=A0ABV5FD14_9FLAO